jgi:hypothetical protein
MMEEQSHTPLVGPTRRRNWRAVLSFQPQTVNAHTAVVRLRRGRVVGIVPANDRRTLSDYLDWPYEYREVDMRERPLVLSLDLESLDVGYRFDVALQITYQVVNIEHVVLAHADVLSELREAIAQRARAIARSLGIEQSSTLKEYLTEALTAGNELPKRYEALGLALRRVDITVDLGRRERTRAAEIAEHTRPRPFRRPFEVASATPEHTFHVQVGGFYRLSERNLQPGTTGDAEAALERAIAHALHRVAGEFDHAAGLQAIQAMTEDLWHSTILKADLAAVGIELLRPAVHLDRSAQRSLPLPSATGALPPPIAAPPIQPPALTTSGDRWDPPATPPSPAADVFPARADEGFRWSAIADEPPATPTSDFRWDAVVESHGADSKPPGDSRNKASDTVAHDFRWSAIDGDGAMDDTPASDFRWDAVDGGSATDDTPASDFRWDAVDGGSATDDTPASDFRWDAVDGGSATDDTPASDFRWDAVDDAPAFNWQSAEPAAEQGSWPWEHDQSQSGHHTAPPRNESDLHAPGEAVDTNMAKRVEAWVTLIAAHGDHHIEVYAGELSQEPTRLPAILIELDADSDALEGADDRYHQMALAMALRTRVNGMHNNSIQHTGGES